jgi:hypothetical protein
LEPQRKPATRKPRGAVKKNAAGKPEDHPLRLPHIAELIAYGEITVGQLRPIGCVATACDEDITMAMLVRRKGETLLQLLTRLDQAIAKAYEENIYTDEINPPDSHT